MEILNWDNLLPKLEDVLDIRYVGGMTPVEGEGTINGWEFYFRSRGMGWTFIVSMCDFDPVDILCGVTGDHFMVSDSSYPWPQAGYITAHAATEIIKRCAADFLREHSRAKTQP